MAIIFAGLPIQALLLKAIDNIGPNTTATLFLLQAISSLVLAAGLALANIFLTRKAILTTKMAYETSSELDPKLTEKGTGSLQPSRVSHIHLEIEHASVKGGIDDVDHVYF